MLTGSHILRAGSPTLYPIHHGQLHCVVQERGTRPSLPPVSYRDSSPVLITLGLVFLTTAGGEGEDIILEPTPPHHSRVAGPSVLWSRPLG